MRVIIIHGRRVAAPTWLRLLLMISVLQIANAKISASGNYKELGMNEMKTYRWPWPRIPAVKTQQQLLKLFLASFREFWGNLKIALTRLDRSYSPSIKKCLNHESISSWLLQIKFKHLQIAWSLLKRQVRTRSAQIVHFCGKKSLRIQQTHLDSSEKFTCSEKLWINWS